MSPHIFFAPKTYPRVRQIQCIESLHQPFLWCEEVVCKNAKKSSSWRITLTLYVCIPMCIWIYRKRYPIQSCQYGHQGQKSNSLIFLKIQWRNQDVQTQRGFQSHPLDQTTASLTLNFGWFQSTKKTLPLQYTLQYRQKPCKTSCVNSKQKNILHRSFPFQLY